MKMLSWFCMAALITVTVPGVQAQEPPKPGPEHELLKKREGTWDTTMKSAGAEFKGTITYKMELGGLWLVGSMETDLGGQKFQGKSLDTYDAGKKKFIGVWADSMGTSPMLMEGTMDPVKKTLTMIADSPGLDGKMTKWKSVAEFTDNDTFQLTMFVGNTKEPMFTVVYKRKK